MSTYPLRAARPSVQASPPNASSTNQDRLADKVAAAARVTKFTFGKSVSFVVSLLTSILGVLGLASFTVAGFLLNTIVGFVVLGFVLLLLDKAVRRERTSDGDA